MFLQYQVVRLETCGTCFLFVLDAAFSKTVDITGEEICFAVCFSMVLFFSLFSHIQCPQLLGCPEPTHRGFTAVLVAAVPW